MPGASVIHFNAPDWYDCPGPGGIQIKGRNRLDFRGINLSGVSIDRAFAEGLNLCGVPYPKRARDLFNAISLHPKRTRASAAVVLSSRKPGRL
jgi:hypothetical protein